MAYIPVLGAEQIKFLCRIIFRGFLANNEQTGFNGFSKSTSFLNTFLLYLHHTKVWYYVIIAIFIKNIFAFTKQTFDQTYYNIYEFKILLNHATYFRASFFVNPGKFAQKIIYNEAV